MAIYRFESIKASYKNFSDTLELQAAFGAFKANGIEVSKETYDRLLAELEANEAQPDPPKESGAVWQGPGWYECKIFPEPHFIIGSKNGVNTVRGVRVFEHELTRLIRLATDEELRHVCTYGTEPDSRLEGDE